MKNLNFLKQNLIAHRGVHNDEVPENSIKAFQIAIKNKYIIELDVHLLKDDTIIVFHDDNLKRMTGKNKTISSCSYNDIKGLKLLNTEYKIPTLKETLQLINGKVPVIIELKFDRKTGLLEKELVKQLDKYNGVFCIKSFNPFIVRWFKKNRPNYIRGLLVSNKTNTLKQKLLHTKLPYLLCKPDFISCHYSLVNNKTIKIYQKKLPVILWSIKTEKNYNRYKNKFYNLIIDNFEFINKNM